MKSSHHVWIRVLVAGACAVNALYVIPNSWEAVRTALSMRGLSNVQRRILQKGAWYQALLTIDHDIPPRASIRLVSSAPPWYLAYYLYPRLLRRGSEQPADLDRVRRQYPEEWTLLYSESPTAEMKAYPPLKSGGAS